MSDYTYLASPYSHPDPAVREERFRLAVAAAAKLMKQGEIVFCPIAHSHCIDLKFDSPESGEFWKRQDWPMLRGADRLVVLMIDGWEESDGIMHEVGVAKNIGIPVGYMYAD